MIKLASIAAILLTAASGLTAQSGGGTGFPDPFGEVLDAKVSATARLTRSPVRAGEVTTLEVLVSIQAGWHIYGALERDGTPTTLTLDSAAGVKAVGETVVPPGTEHESFGMVSYWILGEGELTQKVRVPTDAQPGEITVHGVLDYTACNEDFCDPPGQVKFSAKLKIEAGEARDEFAAPASGGPGDVDGALPNLLVGEFGGIDTKGAPGGSNGAEAVLGTSTTKATTGEPRPPVDAGAPVALRQPLRSLDGEAANAETSLWSLILLCIGGGLIALVMPCTYPMIPITFSFFTKQADARGGNVVPLALAYGAGIVLIFIAIGVLVGPIIIAFASHWITNLLIGGAFVLFAFVLFGWVTLQPPQFLTGAAGRASATGGLLGVFLMGATLVITSFTCTAPIVGSLIAGVAQGGVSQLDVAIGMGVFGLTMATPFVLLALLPGKVKQLPKSGEWMHTLKVSLGFIELAAALKFLSNVDVVLDLQLLPREVFLFAWAFVFTLMALFLFGLFAGTGAQSAAVSKVRNSIGVAVLALAFYCVGGASGLRLDFVMTAFEPPYQLRPIEEHAIVKDDHVAAVAQARREHKYILVNFTGFN